MVINYDFRFKFKTIVTNIGFTLITIVLKLKSHLIIMVLKQIIIIIK